MNHAEGLKLDMPAPGPSDLAGPHDLYRQLFEHSPVATWILHEARILACNAAACRLLGAEGPASLVNTPFYAHAPALQADGQPSARKIEAAVPLARTQPSYALEWELSHPDGHRLVGEISLSVIAPTDPSLLVCVWRDLSQQRASEGALSDSEQLYRDVTDNGQALIWLSGTDKACYYFNQPWLRFTGRSMDQERGNGWTEGVHPDDFDRCLDTYVRAFDRREKFSMVYRLRRHDGAYRWILDDGAPRYNSHQQFVGYVGHCLDITEQKVVEEQVRAMAFHDPLTNLLNRRHLMERLSQSMASSKRSGNHAALIFLDLDHFKPLNDRYGHKVGDCLLIETATRLTGSVRAVDAVARFGGDEFVVILGDLHPERGASLELAGRIAEKMRISLSAPYCLSAAGLEPMPQYLSASLGVVVFLGHESGQDDLLKWGDAAMYQAKKAGRNAICFHAN